MRIEQPRVGHVVRPVKHVRDAYEGEDILLGNLSSAVGIVTECIGIRCKVYWQTGVTTEHPRIELEVISNG